MRRWSSYAATQIAIELGMDILPRISVTSVTGVEPAAGRPARIARVLGGRISSRAGTTSFYIFMIAVFAVFGISTVPGVRPTGHTGYNLILDGILNNLAYALSPILCFLRARKATSNRSSWLILALGLALYGFGNIYWTIFIRPMADPPFPSVADGFWLSFYPCAFIALLLVIRDFAGKLPLSLWLDGIVGGLAVAAIAAAVVGPVLKAVHANGDSTAAIVTTEAYPLLDVLLLLVVTALLALYHWRPPASMWFLAGGLALFSVADCIYLVLVAHNSYQPGGLDDTTWVVATAVVALAPGWSKKAGGFALPAWVLLGIPVVATLCTVALLVYDHGHMLHPIAVALAAATIVAAIGRLVVSFREVSTLAHSRQLALTDELTGLGNRRAFYEHVDTYLAADPDRNGALFLLDLDRFKEVNDSLGHHAGDDLLLQVATRLTDGLTHEDGLLARLGGDEFSIFVLDVDRDGAEMFAEMVRQTLLAPFTIDGITVRVAASVGISLFPKHGLEVSTLLRRADIAMYHAKDLRTGFRVYSESDDSLGGQDRLRTLEELRQVIQARKLAMHYQPKVDSQTSYVSGVEALVRWDHPVHGLLPPDAFLPLAEDAGLMRDLTMAVLEQSLDQVSVWRANGRMLSVAVNLSASSLVDLELPERVHQLLVNRGLPASALELEITEDFLMGDRERAREILTQLRTLGIRVAVDDFGTGYSSLAYLRELPIDELKLDRSFVQPMADDPRAAAIVRSTISLAHSLGMRLVAEGVENEITAGHLALSGCDVSQGFFFSKALPPLELERWLDDRPDMAGMEANAAHIGARAADGLAS
jgi:diguanylate cyclase (GGDEF)-like protein